MKEQAYHILSIVGVGFFFLPIIVVTLRRLWKDPAFSLFSLYWMITGLVNLVDYFPSLNPAVRETINVIYNMGDILLLVIILYVNAVDEFRKKVIGIAGLLYLVVVTISVIHGGFVYSSGKYSLGIGLIIILGSVSWTIIDYLMKLRHTRRQRALLFLYAALMFQFGTFVIIYIFDYFIPNSSKTDSFMLYYISSIIAIGIALFGLTRKGLRGKGLNAEF